MSGSNGRISRTLTIKNKLGLHARAASKLVFVSNQFASDIFVCKDGQEVNGKSIMGILILAAGCGSDIVVSAAGADAEKALDAIESLVERRFEEEG